MPQSERKDSRFPEKIGRYDILLPIASGGMGTVLLARISGAHGFEREVALKLMHAHLREAEGFALDLVEEGKLAVRIRHPNVVSVLDVGEDQAGLYLVMDYVEGDSLWGLLRAAQDKSEQIPIPIGIRILVDALSGLHAAHEVKDAKGEPVLLVHRDFSPHNIIVGTDGIGRLTDFGVAKAANRIGTTGTGIVKGKMAYMSPEQARGDEVDRRTDVWAAGVIAWEIVAGKRLFPSGNDASTLLKIVQSPPPSLSEVVPGIAPGIDAVVMKALSHDLAERWPTAAAFRNALVAACAEVRLTAETEDVGDYVTRLVGARLAQRRERMNEVMKDRDLIEPITEVEVEHTPSKSTSRPAVKVDPPPSISSLPPASLPSVSSSLPVPSFAANEVTEQDPPRRSPMLFLLLGALFLVAVAGGIVVVFATFKKNPPVAAAPAVTPKVVPSSAVVAPVETTAPAPTVSEPTKHVVHLRANAPLASIAIGDRTIKLDGARETDIELTADEAGAKLEAVAVDKRRTSITWVAGATSAQATFAAPVVVTTPAVTKTSTAPALAPLPYGH